MSDAYEDGYYDENGYWIATGLEIAESKNVDSHGRLIDPAKIAEDSGPENFDLFVSKWLPPRMTAKVEWDRTSQIVFPHVAKPIYPVRCDLFELDNPRCQQLLTDMDESRRLRCISHWSFVMTFYVIDTQMEWTKEILIESAGPPRRHRFRPFDKKNHRDLTTWLPKNSIHAYFGSDRIPGTIAFGVDFLDSPDRYFIGDGLEPTSGCRRLYRFGAYPATQFYVLEKEIEHECLESDGGVGMTYMIQSGSAVFAQKGWRLTHSFFAFNQELTSSSLYTVYSRNDPFPRMLVAMGPIEDADQWAVAATFYAFDFPAPGTCALNLQHCIRSIESMAACVPRHRLTSKEVAHPWDFRMEIYVMPAELGDCTLTDVDPSAPPAIYNPFAAAGGSGGGH